MTPESTERSGSRITALILDADRFEADYVASVLTERDIAVVGPFSDLTAALSAIATAPPRTAVLGRQESPEARSRLVAVLAEQQIPYLCLLQSATVPPALRDNAVLARPFAAYQVAEWVVANAG